LSVIISSVQIEAVSDLINRESISLKQARRKRWPEHEGKDSPISSEVFRRLNLADDEGNEKLFEQEDAARPSDMTRKLLERLHFISGQASGVRWLNIGATAPKGQELENMKLAEALQSKAEFTREEWQAFKVDNLRLDTYIKSGDRYFQPISALGLRWLNIGTAHPTKLDDRLELVDHPQLAEALQGKTEFSQQEWQAFGIVDLRVDSFIRCPDGFYFKPSAVPAPVIEELQELLIYWGGSLCTAAHSWSASVREVTCRNPISDQKVFDQLTLEYCTNAPTPTANPRTSRAGRNISFGLRAGCIIGLHTGAEEHTRVGPARRGNADEYSEGMLLNLLHGRLKPDHGTALCLLRTALVGPRPTLIPNVSFIENLIGGLPEERIPKGEKQLEGLWNLCRRVGMSETLIGREDADGGIPEDHDDWHAQLKKMLPNEDLLSHSDLLRINLVRALFKQPTMLLLHRIGYKEQLLALMPILREYLEGKFDALLNGDDELQHVLGSEPQHKHGRRSIILAVPQRILMKVLDPKQGDMLLHLESASKATLSNFETPERVDEI